MYITLNWFSELFYTSIIWLRYIIIITFAFLEMMHGFGLFLEINNNYINCFQNLSVPNDIWKFSFLWPKVTNTTETSKTNSGSSREAQMNCQHYYRLFLCVIWTKRHVRSVKMAMVPLNMANDGTDQNF